MSSALRVWSRAPHLSAAGLALILSAVLAWLLFTQLHIERRLAHLTAPAMMEVKDQGFSLQDEAFRDKDLLPIYGSSEFRNDSPYAGRMFFSNYPTGFGLFVVGKAGAKTLIMAQRIGALGNKVRGRKVVIILSPTWFLARQEGRSFYNGNFSAFQARELIFNSPLSPGLKSDIAREMLKYPKTLADQKLLRFEVRRLAAKSDSLEDRLAMDLGRSEDDFLQILDRCQTALALSGTMLSNPRGLLDVGRHPKEKPKWNELMRAAGAASGEIRDPFASSPAQLDSASTRLENKLSGKNRPPFLTMLEQSDEWGHLDILLRTLRELGARPLFISIPINATAFSSAGVREADRKFYYARLRNELRAYGYPFDTFEEREGDPAFFSDDLGHPSAKGWMVFNQLIDKFYHDKLPATSH